MTTFHQDAWHDCVIDEVGEAWPPHSQAYAQRVGYPVPDFDLVGYAVRNLGHARVTLRGAAAHIVFRPSAISAVTLAGVFLAVFECRPERVALAYHVTPGTFSHEIFGSAQAAFARMEALVLKSAGMTLPRFVAEQRSVFQLDREVAGRMLAIIDLWNSTGAHWTPTLLTRFRELGVNQTAMVARMPVRSHRVVIEECGGGYTFADEARWRGTLSVGHDLEDLPDREYGAWAAAEYRRALGADTPRIETVKALIRTSGLAVRRSQYARLLLPWNASRGDRVVTSIGFVKASALVH